MHPSARPSCNCMYASLSTIINIFLATMSCTIQVDTTIQKYYHYHPSSNQNCTFTSTSKKFNSWVFAGHSKRRACSTGYSQAVTHPSTRPARHWLTSVIGREPVYSAWYGRRHWCLLVSCFYWCTIMSQQSPFNDWPFPQHNLPDQLTHQN